MIQSLIELLAGFIALIAAAALSQFGVDLNSPDKASEKFTASQTAATPPLPRVWSASPLATADSPIQSLRRRLNRWLLFSLSSMMVRVGFPRAAVPTREQ